MGLFSNPTQSYHSFHFRVQLSKTNRIYLSQNPTLEHYTRYKASELKNTVLELQELQLNKKGGMLSAIREKYKQPKVKNRRFLTKKLAQYQHLLNTLWVCAS